VAARRRLEWLAVAAVPALPAWSSVGGGNHSAAVSHSDSNHYGGAVGSGGSVGGMIGLIVLALLIAYVARRLKGNAQVTQAFTSAPPQAQAVLTALGSVLGAATLQRGGGSAGFSGNVVSGTQFQPAIDALRALDPGFEMETFLQRAEMTFFLVKRGLQKNDSGFIRPYLNDPMFAELSRIMETSRSAHRRLMLESLNVQALHLQNAECGDAEQRLEVHFDLVYRAKMLDDANRAVSDEGADTRHAERWTFTRSAKARTPISGGVTAAKCPACGAELRLALDGSCTHCKASVTNGSVDWVVAAIQPASYAGYTSEFAVAAATVAEGLATLKAADAQFSLDAFTARVKSAFMALQDAWCRQKLDTGRAFMSPGAYFSWSAQLETLVSEGRRNVMENISVTSVQPIRVVHGRVFDDLTVRICAAAADFEVDQDNKIVFGDREVRPFCEHWTFQRSVGTTTSNKPGTMENTCPRCGAPLALTQIGECRFCKAAVTSGKFDWVVSRIEREQEEQVESGENPSVEIAAQVGAAVIGGLMGSLLSGKGSRF
jgi:predicted lipid-binding transport protein (Tim44 family)